MTGIRETNPLKRWTLISWSSLSSWTRQILHALVCTRLRYTVHGPCTLDSCWSKREENECMSFGIFTCCLSRAYTVMEKSNNTHLYVTKLKKSKYEEEKNSKCDTPKLNMWQNSKIQNVTKLKKTQNVTKLKNSIMTKLNNSKCDKTQMWQDSKFDKPPKVKKWQKSKTKNVKNY